MASRIFIWTDTPQLSIVGILLAFSLPSAGGFMFFHLILPALVDADMPVLVAYSLVAAAGLFIILLAGFLLMRREATSLGIPLTSRMAFQRMPRRRALIAGGILLLGFVLAVGAAQLVLPLVDARRFTIPNYMPFFLNPRID